MDTATATAVVETMGTPILTDRLLLTLHMEGEEMIRMGTRTDRLPLPLIPPMEGTLTDTPTAKIIAEGELGSFPEPLGRCSLELNRQALAEVWRSCNRCSRWWLA